MANEYELIHVMDVSPDANVRRAVRVLAELHKDEPGRIGEVARFAIDLANKIDRMDKEGLEAAMNSEHRSKWLTKP